MANNALTTAIHLGRLDNVVAAIAAGADPNFVDDRGVPVLTVAVMSYMPRPEIVDYLLKSGANPDTKNGRDYEPIFYIIDNPRMNEILQILLQHGANPNVIFFYTPDYAKTPLSQAAFNNPEGVKILLAYGADPNLGGPITFYLNNAIDHGNTESLVDLLLAGAIPYNEIPGLGSVEWAKYKGNMEALGILTRAIYEDPETVVEKGSTNLMIAVNNRDVSRLRLYIPKIKNIDRQNRSGNTALHYAINNYIRDIEDAENNVGKNLRIVNLLLANGANPLIKNNGGGSPLDYAIENGLQDIVELFAQNVRDRLSEEVNEIYIPFIHQPGGRLAKSSFSEWKAQIYPEDIPQYQKATYAQCVNQDVTQADMLSTAVEIGFDEEKLKDKSKDEICRILIEYFKILKP